MSPYHLGSDAQRDSIIGIPKTKFSKSLLSLQERLSVLKASALKNKRQPRKYVSATNLMPLVTSKCSYGGPILTLFPREIVGIVKDIDRMRIGLPANFFACGVDAAVKNQEEEEEEARRIDAGKNTVQSSSSLLIEFSHPLVDNYTPADIDKIRACNIIERWLMEENAQKRPYAKVQKFYSSSSESTRILHHEYHSNRHQNVDSSCENMPTARIYKSNYLSLPTFLNLGFKNTRQQRNGNQPAALHRTSVEMNDPVADVMANELDLKVEIFGDSLAQPPPSVFDIYNPLVLVPQNLDISYITRGAPCKSVCNILGASSSRPHHSQIVDQSESTNLGHVSLPTATRIPCANELLRYTKGLKNQAVVPPHLSTVLLSSGKIRALDQLLYKLKHGGHRCLLYCQMTKSMDLMQSYLKMRGYRHIRLDGSTTLGDRKDLVSDWQTQDDLFIFLLSTRAGGVGINLTAADTVIFFESDWNPTMDWQAMDRAHRVGQTRQVTVYRLCTKKSIEEHILARARTKDHIQRLVIAGGSTAPERTAEGFEIENPHFYDDEDGAAAAAAADAAATAQAEDEMEANIAADNGSNSKSKAGGAAGRGGGKGDASSNGTAPCNVVAMPKVSDIAALLLNPEEKERITRQIQEEEKLKAVAAAEATKQKAESRRLAAAERRRVATQTRRKQKADAAAAAAADAVIATTTSPPAEDDVVVSNLIDTNTAANILSNTVILESPVRGQTKSGLSQTLVAVTPSSKKSSSVVVTPKSTSSSASRRRSLASKVASKKSGSIGEDSR